mmetsp:Transcript_5645/g.12380  ORF Transcript_5645/g.12380 Transcript_5645/m.12380 type:complete len:231 (+) Transcript_5645:634-1326(+)
MEPMSRFFVLAAGEWDVSGLLGRLLVQPSSPASRYWAYARRGGEVGGANSARQKGVSQVSYLSNNIIPSHFQSNSFNPFSLSSPLCAAGRLERLKAEESHLALLALFRAQNRAVLDSLLLTSESSGLGGSASSLTAAVASMATPSGPVAAITARRWFWTASSPPTALNPPHTTPPSAIIQNSAAFGSRRMDCLALPRLNSGGSSCRAREPLGGARSVSEWSYTGSKFDDG